MFPEAAQYDITRIPGQVAGIDPAVTSRMKMLTGHQFYGLHEEYENCRGYITLLRETVERVVSFYYYYVEDLSCRFGRILNDNKISLEHFVSMEAKEIDRLDWQELHYSVENGQTKLLAGETVKAGEASNGLYEKALRNIEDKVLFLGLQERYDESVVSIQEILGWKKPLYYQKINVNDSRPKGEEIPDSIVKIIKERNRIDTKLHEKFTADFDSRLPLPANEIQKRVNKMRKLNTVYAGYISVRKSVSRLVKGR
jgi:hypothetical protein